MTSFPEDEDCRCFQTLVHIYQTTQQPTQKDPNLVHSYENLKSNIGYTRWFKYDRDYLCVNKSQFVPVIFEPPCIMILHQVEILFRFTNNIINLKTLNIAQFIFM
jgi:hypothetical protein